MDDVLNLFKYKVTAKIIRDKEAYLLHERLKDVKYLGELDLDTQAIEHTSTLKMYFIKNRTQHSSRQTNIYWFIPLTLIHALIQLQHSMD